MKPVELVGRALLNSSHKGDAVLDLFGGSGTTLIAAEQTERVARLMELDPKYTWVIAERFHRNFPDAEITVERDGEVLTYAQVRQSV
jgi:DNA modification methylase